MGSVAFKTKRGKLIAFKTGGKKKRGRRKHKTPPRSRKTGKFLKR